MNLAIIGGRNPKKLSDIIYSSFDDMAITCYNDIDAFMEAVAIRAIDIHRMILLQDGVDTVSDEGIYNFTDLIQRSYPAMKMITLCKDVEMVKFMAELFPGGNSAHFCATGLKAKMLTDLVSLDINVLNKKYENLRYVIEHKTDVEVIEEVAYQENEGIDNTQVPGYVPPPQPQEQKRGFFSKVFGLKPKSQNTKLVTDGELKNIGQGVGVDEFSQGLEQPDFGEQIDENEQGIDYNIFGGGGDLDLGLGLETNEDAMADEAHSIMEKYNNEDAEEKQIFVDLTKYNDNDSEMEEYSEKEELEDEINEDFEIPKISVNLDKEIVDDEPEYTPVLEINKDEDTDFEKLENDFDLNLPKMDLEGLKKTIEDTNIQVSSELPNAPIIPDLNLDETQDEEIDLFGDNLDSLMKDYEESNKKVVEKVVERVVEKVVTINSGESGFRNKNGIKILVITGDRRVGSTKLALNLANMYSKREKVLYVDFDRFRHGSLGYLDLDTILEEEEHVQNGLNHLKSLNILPNVLHLYRKGGFFTLLSMYGTDINDKQMIQAQEVLSKQREFTTIIIDCPLENIYLLRDILYLSHILICAEDDKVGIVNLMTMLGSCCGEEKFLSAIYDRAYYVVGRKGNVDNFRSILHEVLDLFEIELFDWNNIEVLGTLKGTKLLAERVGD